jgi:hypothetical protein
VLVSGTNIAVDNALVGVVRERRHQPGDIVRVGPPQLPEIIDDPDVCLPLKVRARLAEVEEQRRTAATDLLEMNRRQERLQGIETRLEGFDPVPYGAAVALLAAPGSSVAEVSSDLARCELQAENGLRAIAAARRELQAVQAAAAEADPFRPQWAEIKDMEAELAEVENAAQKSERRALVAKKTLDDADDSINELSRPDGKVRWRDRGALRDAQERFDIAREKYEPLRADAAEARRVANTFRRDTESTIARLSASSPLSRNEIRRRDTAVAQAGMRVRAFEAAQFSTLNRLTELRAAQAVSLAAEELVTACAGRGWPELHVQVASLRRDIARDRGQASQR